MLSELGQAQLLCCHLSCACVINVIARNARAVRAISSLTLTAQHFLQVVSELVESARNNDYTDVVMIHEHRGEPDGIVVCHLPYGPSAYFGIFNTVSYLCMHLHVHSQSCKGCEQAR